MAAYDGVAVVGVTTTLPSQKTVGYQPSFKCFKGVHRRLCRIAELMNEAVSLKEWEGR